MSKKLAKIFLFSTVFALIAVMVLTGCVKNNDNNETQETQKGTVTKIGEGETSFSFEVTDDNGEVVNYLINTDEKTVGAALLKAGLIDDDSSGYIKKVNGIEADFDKDKAYWAFYIDGKYAVVGINETDIETEKVYAFVYTKE